jgi:hypothetical protein
MTCKLRYIPVICLVATKAIECNKQAASEEERRRRSSMWLLGTGKNANLERIMGDLNNAYRTEP